MGVLTSKPYAVLEGEEYVAYLDQLLVECERLSAEGRLPSDPGVIAWQDDVRGVRDRIRRDVLVARQQGAADATRVTTALDLTQPEHDRLLAMSESVRNLLEILRFRQAFDLDRSAAAERVAAAMREGDWSPTG